ncbi:hypothetical protein [Mesomycoplasma molare]|uniref:Single-stranded DNA-binding protein n=1 Tax=Mesomycoplasma molare TaxID=171288 RepID=A0ABY5TVC2_9BACT|nr:hypothetical protein [Mesomycoplasma molare]UWD34500.1 hypothetical protein NX772_01560 [Mesomycoplasma molare]
MNNKEINTFNKLILKGKLIAPVFVNETEKNKKAYSTIYIVQNKNIFPIRIFGDKMVRTFAEVAKKGDIIELEGSITTKSREAKNIFDKFPEFKVTSTNIISINDQKFDYSQFNKQEQAISDTEWNSFLEEENSKKEEELQLTEFEIENLL